MIEYYNTGIYACYHLTWRREKFLEGAFEYCKCDSNLLFDSPRYFRIRTGGSFVRPCIGPAGRAGARSSDIRSPPAAVSKGDGD